MCDLRPSPRHDDHPHKLPALLSLGQVAEYFGCCTRTVRRWIAAGRLHPVRIGRAMFVRADEVARLVHVDLLDGILPGSDAPKGGQ
jgi:excisionase family DNA binding protein